MTWGDDAVEVVEAVESCVDGVGAELAHSRRQLAVRIHESRRHILCRHRHEVLSAMHVDPRRVAIVVFPRACY